MAEIRQRILLVGGDPAQLDFLTSALQQICEITTASSAQQALQLAESAPFPELILLDAQTPELDGYKLCQELKHGSNTQTIPVILLTDGHKGIDAAEELGSGAIDYLTIPLNAAHVAARVKSHLRLSAMTKELEEQAIIRSEYMRLKDVIERLCKYDFKAPLQAFIDIPAQLSRELSMNLSQTEKLNSLSQMASNLLTVISRSTDLYKMEEGTYQLVSVSVDLVKIIKQIFQEHRSLAEKRGIRFAVNINQKPAAVNETFAVQGEESLFILMLTDLIKNAIEASPEKSEVVIALDSSPHPTIAIKISG
ncbi:MAG: two-component hybrid sensor and regulator, partial [uncultured bacterium]